MDDPASPAPAWRVRDGHDAFAARAGETVLAAAARAGLEWPSSCRNGTCRACLRQLASGEVAYAIEWPGVLPDERRAGWFLPCVAQARSDLVLRDAPGDHELPVT